MVTIQVRPGVSRAQFEELARKWDVAKNAVLEVGIPASDEELREFSSFLLDLVNLDLARSALAELCEKPEVPQDILERVFLEGGTACRVAICLRADLSTSLKEMCARCGEAVVLEHFKQSQQSLL
jgi:hypothetical protein